MEMDKIKRNRLLVGGTLALLVVAVLVVNAFLPGFMLPLLERFQEEEEVAQTPEQIIEESPLADVIYYEAPETGKSAFLGDTPIVGVGVIYYKPDVLDLPYHVRLTPQGYDIIRGAYEWSPDVPEDEPGSYWHLYNSWSWEKYQYYDENALFKPGQATRVREALWDMSEWAAQKMLAEMFYGIIKAAVQTEGEWRAIEIDLVELGFPREAFAVESGNPARAVIFPERLTTTIVIFRSRKEEIFLEGKWVTITRRLDQIVERGELPYGELQEMLKAGQIQFVPAQTMFSLRSYSRGFNCEWQGREIEMIKEAMQQ